VTESANGTQVGFPITTAPPALTLTIDGGEFGQVIIDGNSGGKLETTSLGIVINSLTNRVFFVDSGTVTLANLQIQDAVAKGGDGGLGGDAGGGGGAGLGGCIFVNKSNAILTVQNTYFNDCQVVGGSGGSGGNLSLNSGSGGGGGMAYNGGGGGILISNESGGGGGIISAGAGGGKSGTGGGGGGSANGPTTGGAGYGSNSSGNSNSSQSEILLYCAGGNGGFGGGGGGGVMCDAGNGGFGGGGGGSDIGTGSGGSGGFGGGNGGNTCDSGISSSNCSGTFNGGAGGSAFGPDIFINTGSISIINSGFFNDDSHPPATAGKGAGGFLSGPVNSNGQADYATAYNYGGSINGSSTTGGIYALEMALPATHFSISVPTNSLRAGIPATFTITALNNWGEPTPVYNGTFNLTALDYHGNSISITPTSVRYYNYMPNSFSATLNTVGLNTLIATDSLSSYITGSSGAFDVIPGPAAQIVVTAPSVVTAGNSFSFTVKEEDSYGNLTWDGAAFSSSDSAASLPATTTSYASRGVFSATLNTAGPRHIYVTDPENASITGTSAKITVSPYPPPTISESLSPNPAYLGLSTTQTVMDVTIINPLSSLQYTGVGFSLALPTGLTLGSGANNYCGGTLTAVPGSSTLTLAGVSIPAIDQCDVTIPIVATATGIYTIPSGTVTSAQTGAATVASNTFTVLAAPNFVVTTAQDDSGTAGNCTQQTAAGTGTDAACSLRDALAQAANTGAGLISFDKTAFATAQTITLGSSYGTLNLSPSTFIRGATSGSGGTLTNLVTVDGSQIGAGIFNFNTESQGAFAGIDHLILANSNYSGGTGGAIYNYEILAVTNSTFTGNTVPGGGGGAIYSSGTLTVSNSTFTGNTAPGGMGGAIFSSGTLTVTNSTFSGNQAGAGGAIESDNASTSVSNSTFSGNTATSTGGAIESDSSWLGAYNNIFVGNTAATSGSGGGVNSGAGYGGNSSTINADSNVFYNNLDVTSSGNTEDDCNGCATNGNTNTNAVAGDPLLAPLGNYGGSTKTMLPQPGSAAICAGATGSVPSGVTTDQRGLARTSTYDGTACVDAGALQTHYALAFTTEPPAKPYFGQPIAPAPAVTLTESGAIATAANSPVALTDSAALLTGTTSANMAAGTATFNNLILSAVDSSDTLTATLALNSSINLTAQSTAFAAFYSPAVLTSPTPGSTLSTSSVTFTWTTGTGATEYAVSVGNTSKGSYNLYRSPTLRNQTSISVSLPINDENLYVSLCSFINSTWQCNYYNYSTSGTPVLATLTSPAPGSTLTSSSATFQWSAGSGVSGYILALSATNPGSHDLYSGTSTTATSASVTGLPTNGLPIYARLYSHINGSWAQYIDYVYNPATAATLASPTQGTALAATGQVFTWAPVTGATGYTLYLGTSAGGGNLLDAHTTATTFTAGNLPANGGTIYARLWTNFNGTWKYTDSTFTAAAPAALTSPGEGTTLAATGQVFTWAQVTGATGYTFYLGTSQGAGNLLDAHTTATTVTAGKLPTGTVWVRLWTNINGVWTYTDSNFLAQ